ncbi:MAG: glycosyltransferase family 4 protein [Planctomycetes bacterium]|nr:glycosyltransferase family 4 protein [Planctomycetota bacterium]
MRVLHLIARLNDGGPARVIAQLARTLPAHGITLEVAAGRCAADEGDLAPRLRAEGLHLTDVPELGRAPALLGDVRALAAVLRLIRARRPALVHTHTAKAGALGRIACRLLGVPCLHTYHGHVLDGYFSAAANLALHTVERLLAGGCHHHALTPGQLHELRDLHAIGRPQRWHLLPIPVAPVVRTRAAWHQTLIPGVPVLGFLGRLTAVKDVDLWLATLAELRRRQPLQGLVCGDGQERARLESAARALDLPVRFTGTVPAGEALAAMDVLLMTSRNEGLPLVAIEAASAQVPVVAPAVGGLADLIRWGVVAGGERTAVALAAACQRLLLAGPLRQARLAVAGRVAEHLTPDRLAPAYAALYRTISEVHRPGVQTW